MPTHFLNIPHRIQEREAGCLAACAQMALSHLGISQPQTSLNRLLGLTSIGTPYSNVGRLAEFNVSVILQPGNETDLRQTIDSHRPAIVFLMTDDLPYWQDNTSHAVVVVGYDETAVLLNDPAFIDAPQSVAWNDFMLAWGEQDFMFARLR